MSNKLNISVKDSVKGEKLLTLIGGKVKDGIYKYTSGGVFCISIGKEYCELTAFMTVCNEPDESGDMQKKIYLDSVHPPEAEDIIMLNANKISESYEKILLEKINSISPILFV